MKLSRKKIAIVTGSVIAVLLILATTTPYLFKDKIINAIISEAGKNINAHVKFEDVSFSLIRNFPNLRVSLDDVTIIGKGEFKGVHKGKPDAEDLKAAAVFAGSFME